MLEIKNQNNKLSKTKRYNLRYIHKQYCVYDVIWFLIKELKIEDIKY